MRYGVTPLHILGAACCGVAAADKHQLACFTPFAAPSYRACFVIHVNRLTNSTLASCRLFDITSETLNGLPQTLCFFVRLQERVLPPIASLEVRIDSSLKHLPLFTSDMEEVCGNAMVDNQAGTSSLACYLRVRAKLMEVAGLQVAVVFTGVETGRAEVSLRAPKPTDAPYISGEPI